MNNNNLDALFTGLTGTNTEETVSKQPTALPPSVDERKGKKATPSTKQPEERFCTIVSSALLRKIRIIANREGLQIKDTKRAFHLHDVAVEKLSFRAGRKDYRQFSNS